MAPKDQSCRPTWGTDRPLHRRHSQAFGIYRSRGVAAMAEDVSLTNYSLPILGEDVAADGSCDRAPARTADHGPVATQIEAGFEGAWLSALQPLPAAEALARLKAATQALQSSFLRHGSHAPGRRQWETPTARPAQPPQPLHSAWPGRAGAAVRPPQPPPSPRRLRLEPEPASVRRPLPQQAPWWRPGRASVPPPRLQHRTRPEPGPASRLPPLRPPQPERRPRPPSSELLVAELLVAPKRHRRSQPSKWP